MNILVLLHYSMFNMATKISTYNHIIWTKDEGSGAFSRSYEVLKGLKLGETY